jgi:hypothetical protein
MSSNSDQHTTADKRPRVPLWEYPFIALFAVGFLFWPLYLWSPIPGCKEPRDKSWAAAGAFLKERFPDRELSTPPDCDRAAVAVVFHLIRSGSLEVARRAIEFATEQRYGYAAPYVIGRLGSGDVELEHAAQTYLRTIAGRDYGPDAASWRLWWRDPPLELYGIASVGHTTLRIVMPATLAIVGFAVLAVCRRWRLEAAVGLAGALLTVAWFFVYWFLSTQHLNPAYYTCTFGSSQIAYFAGRGSVVGLEDAQVAGSGYPHLATVVFLFGAWVIRVACKAVGGGGIVK